MRARSLMYHDLSDRPSGFDNAWARAYKIPEAEFAQHLQAFEAAGVAGLISSVESCSWSEIPVFLTFDDGGASALRMAEMLASRSLRGHFFITTGRIGEAGFLSPEEISRIHALGHTIGSHSVSHPTRMRALSRSELDREWIDSLDTLQQILGVRVRTASVPGGFYSREVGLSAARSGIRFLFCSEPVEVVHTIENCLLIGRYNIQRTTGARNAAAFTRGNWRTCASQRIQWNVRKILKVVLGPAYVAAGRLVRR